VPYWKAHRFSQYLEDAHVHYLADEVDAINRGEAFSAIPYKLMPMKSVALHFWKHPTRTLCQVGPLGSAGDGPVNPRSGRRAALAALRRSGPRRD
jgi:hypothetical protein